MNYSFEEKFFDNREKYAIVINFFNYMLNDDFGEILHYLAMDMSYGEENIGCNLPSLFDEEGEEGFFNDGVVFYEGEAEIKISFSMYVKCIQLACDLFLEKKHDNTEVIKDLEIIQERYRAV